MPRTTHEASVESCARSPRRPRHQRRTSYPVDYPAARQAPATDHKPGGELRPLLPAALFWPAWTDRDCCEAQVEPTIWPAPVDAVVIADSRPEVPLEAFPSKEARA